MGYDYHQLLARFQDPPPAYRPMPFWIWNGEMDASRIARQVADMAEQGCGGFFIHPMGESFRLGDFVRGISPPYLSEGYFAAVRVAVEAARDHGLYAWLYDEGGWPSGTAQGHVLDGHPEHRAKVLRCSGVTVGTASSWDCPEGTVAVLGWSEDRGLQLLSPNGSRVAPPHGVERVLFFFVVQMEGRTDLLSPAAVRRFLDVTHERYAAAVGEFFGTVIPGIFTDEPGVAGLIGTHEVPWTPGMLEAFQQRRGFDLRPFLPALFAEEAVGPAIHACFEPHVIAQVRCEFCDLWTDLYHEAYWKQINDWCEAHGLIHTGHVGGEDTLLEHGRHGFGHFFKTAGALHAPGVDVIWRQLCWNQENFDFPQFASSAAHQRASAPGGPLTRDDFTSLVVSETNGVYGFGLTFEQMRWLVDYQVLRGVNLVAPMSYPYETADGRLFRTMEILGPCSPQWPLYAGFADYVGRLCAVLRSGLPLADVAVYYPIEAAWADPDGAVAERAWRSLRLITRTLHEEQVAFDFIDASAVVGATVAEGALETAGQDYSVIIVPETAIIPLAVLRQLLALYRSGGRVVFLGAIPEFRAEYGPAELFNEIVDELLDVAVTMDQRQEALLPGDTEAGVDEVARWNGLAPAFGMPGRPLDRFPATVRRDQSVLLVPEEETGRLARLLALRVGRYNIQPAGVVPQLRMAVRDLDPLQVAFIMNESQAELECELDVVSERPGLLERWDPATGALQVLAAHAEVAELTRVPLRLRAGESALLVLAPTEHADRANLTPSRPTGLEPVTIVYLDEPTAVHVEAEYRISGGDVEVRGSDAPRDLPTLLGPWEQLGLQDFSGAVTYEFAFSVAPEYLGREVWLDLGEVYYAAHAVLNGEELPLLLWPPYRTDVGELLKEHDNRLAVTVVNTLAQQACATRVVAEARARGWFNGYYDRALPMMRESLQSGLLGPVRLELVED